MQRANRCNTKSSQSLQGASLSVLFAAFLSVVVQRYNKGAIQRINPSNICRLNNLNHRDWRISVRSIVSKTL